VQLIRRDLIEQAQEAAHDLLGRMTHRGHDAIMRLARGQILFGESFKVGAIMSQERLALTDGVGQLLRITVLDLASFAGRHGRKTTGTSPCGHEHIDVLVQIAFDEQGVHDPWTRGSMRSSGMRFRSIDRLISAWWSLS
jgi:hypothetical protein